MARGNVNCKAYTVKRITTQCVGVFVSENVFFSSFLLTFILAMLIRSICCDHSVDLKKNVSSNSFRRKKIVNVTKLILAT